MVGGGTARQDVALALLGGDRASLPSLLLMLCCPPSSLFPHFPPPKADGFHDQLLIMTFLMLERALGPRSPWSPYLSALPDHFDTPLHYSTAQLAEVGGGG